ncbi:hypothetical protein DERP_003179 [Dermatophagoides pteronyssinus]|uniref:Uncharacterized protein n=1 Tax=Dermatophagoides pteronyssinus TaxID=6956 RepID=A0ABQ8JIS3_DERPT|nr:hypothetical protein DERP_003179 [Dermatophagoides pteronyssinus]
MIQPNEDIRPTIYGANIPLINPNINVIPLTVPTKFVINIKQIAGTNIAIVCDNLRMITGRLKYCLTII